MDFQKIIPPLDKATGWQLSAIASAGLAYCYIASAPVLTLHAVRGGLKLTARNGNLLLGIFIFVLAGIPLLAFVIGHLCGSDTVFGLAITAGFVLAQIVLVVVAQWDGVGTINSFYDGLVKARYKDKKGDRDYRDSYRHMREHGNAMTIVILEMILGTILAAIGNETWLVIVLIGWLLPGAYVWVIASMLEGHFVDIGGDVNSPAAPSTAAPAP